jgi:hypothetical protein
MKECTKFPSNTTIKFPIFKEKCIENQLKAQFDKINNACRQCEAGKAVANGERPCIMGVKWF